MSTSLEAAADGRRPFRRRGGVAYGHHERLLARRGRQLRAHRRRRLGALARHRHARGVADRPHRPAGRRFPPPRLHARLRPALVPARHRLGDPRQSHQVFFRVTVPLLKGNVAAGLIAVGLASLASFGVPAMIGTPARRYVLTTAIYAKLREGSADASRSSSVRRRISCGRSPGRAARRTIRKIQYVNPAI